MRSMIAAFAVAGALAGALAAASAAWAAPVTVGQMALAPKAQQKFKQDYGIREADYLARFADRQVALALTKAGAQIVADGLRVEITLLRAEPTKPTFKQLSDKIGLDYMRSRSLGGARLQAKFIDAGGAVLDTVEAGYFEQDLRFSYGQSTWYDAEQGIRNFAYAVAKRYAALTQARAAS